MFYTSHSTQIVGEDMNEKLKAIKKKKTNLGLSSSSKRSQAVSLSSIQDFDFTTEEMIDTNFCE